MPELARFYGIIVTMYFEAEEPHQIPHFHIRYGEYQASYGIMPVVQFAGALPRRQQRLVEAWAELYEGALFENWERIQTGRKALPMPGLR